MSFFKVSCIHAVTSKDLVATVCCTSGGRGWRGIKIRSKNSPWNQGLGKSRVPVMVVCHPWSTLQVDLKSNQTSMWTRKSGHNLFHRHLKTRLQCVGLGRRPGPEPEPCMMRILVKINLSVLRMFSSCRCSASLFPIIPYHKVHDCPSGYLSHPS